MNQRQSTAVNLLAVLLQLVPAVERLACITFASRNGAWMATGSMSLHVAFQIEPAIEQCFAGAAGDAALENLGLLAAGWD